MESYRTMTNTNLPWKLIVSRRALTITRVLTALSVIMLVGCTGTTPRPAIEPEVLDTEPSFAITALSDTSWGVRAVIPSVTLPSASGGNGDLTYTLTPLPPGLSFDPAGRVVSGAPTTVGPYAMTYAVTDEDGDAASLTFKAMVVHSMIFWTDFATGKIHRANLDGTGAKEILTIRDAEPHGIALDVPGNMMYWVEHLSGKIRRANLDGSGAEDLATRRALRAIALDVSGGKMYWTENDTNRIHRANLDGTGEEELTLGLLYPAAIALDLVNRKMYWTEVDGPIRRANLDGTEIDDLVLGDLLDEPYGIALDVPNGKMYWTERATGEIARANLDGSGVENLLTDGTLGPGEIALDLISGKMYWTGPVCEKGSARQPGRLECRRPREYRVG